MASLPWYHKTTIYQIYPRSFYDSNGDGIGDMQGIIQKLDYIHELGFETIWVSPFFTSPQADFGYDISDYTSIAPEYGTLRDAQQLIGEVHHRDMRIVLDMVMNHTSDEHPWFKESRSSRDNPKADWYIWRNPVSRGKGLRARGEPNNWQSMTGGSGWHYAPERGQYFWSSFLPFQPDLNYRNPEVKQAMLDIVRFWLGQGADGFRLDIFNVIYKDAEFRNNPFSFRLVPTDEDPSSFFQQAKYTLNQPESFEFAKDFRSTCDEFGEKLSIGEVNGGRSIIRKFLGEETNNGLTLVFDFEMLNFKFSADYFRQLVREMERHYPDPFMPVYVFSNHDKHRSMSRLGNSIHIPFASSKGKRSERGRKAKLLAMFQLTVRGVPCLYYGEEIGMTDAKFLFTSALDPIPHKFTFLPRFIFDMLGVLINRDEVRTPMQWNGTQNAGFSSAQKTWLPVHENFEAVNVEKQRVEADSLLNVIRELLKIRQQEKCLQEGSLELVENLPMGVLGYARSLEDKKIYALLNFEEREKEFQVEDSERLFNLSTGDQVENNTIHLASYGGLLLSHRKP